MLPDLIDWCGGMGSTAAMGGCIAGCYELGCNVDPAMVADDAPGAEMDAPIEAPVYVDRFILYGPRDALGGSVCEMGLGGEGFDVATGECFSPDGDADADGDTDADGDADTDADVDADVGPGDERWRCRFATDFGEGCIDVSGADGGTSLEEWCLSPGDGSDGGAGVFGAGACDPMGSCYDAGCEVTGGEADTGSIWATHEEPDRPYRIFGPGEVINADECVLVGGSAIEIPLTDADPDSCEVLFSAGSGGASDDTADPDSGDVPDLPLFRCEAFDEDGGLRFCMESETEMPRLCGEVAFGEAEAGVCGTEAWSADDPTSSHVSRCDFTDAEEIILDFVSMDGLVSGFPGMPGIFYGGLDSYGALIEDGVTVDDIPDDLVFYSFGTMGVPGMTTCQQGTAHTPFAFEDYATCVWNEGESCIHGVRHADIKDHCDDLGGDFNQFAKCDDYSSQCRIMTTSVVPGGLDAGIPESGDFGHAYDYFGEEALVAGVCTDIADASAEMGDAAIPEFYCLSEMGSYAASSTDADDDGIPNDEDSAPCTHLDDVGGDVDGDGLPDEEDCAPCDASKPAAEDEDCDGIPDVFECGPDDAVVVGSEDDCPVLSSVVGGTRGHCDTIAHAYLAYGYEMNEIIDMSGSAYHFADDVYGAYTARCLFENDPETWMGEVEGRDPLHPAPGWRWRILESVLEPWM